MDKAGASEGAPAEPWTADDREDARSDAHYHAQSLGEQESVWHKLSVLSRHEDPIGILQRLSAKMGGCIPVNLNGERILFLSDADHFKHVLVSNPDRYGKYFEGLTAIFGNSMITVDGVLWQKIRMPQQAAFQPKMFGAYLPYFLSSIRDKAQDFEAYAKAGATINLLEETWGLAASMICKALFDRELPFNAREVFRAVKAYTDVGHHRAIRLKKVKGELSEVPADDIAADAIGAWLEVPPQVLCAVPHDHREKTLLSMLRDAAADPARPEFDERQVLDEIKQYLSAGTETTALTLTWCFYLLSLYPDVAERIRQEAEGAYGDGVPTWEDVHALSYTRAVIQETMRLYPPVWCLVRVANDHDEIGGHSVAPGDKVALCSYIVHRSPKYWEEPEAFDPTRFFAENAAKRAPYSYVPFSAGRRACIGGALSIVENTLALTELLRQFRLEYVGEHPAVPAATVTLTPEGGRLPFRVHAR